MFENNDEVWRSKIWKLKCVEVLWLYGKVDWFNLIVKDYKLLVLRICFEYFYLYVFLFRWWFLISKVFIYLFL